MKLLQFFEATKSGQMLWHGTTEEWFSKMQTEGVPAKSFWTPDEDIAWYFAQMAQESGGRGEMVVTQLPIGAFDPSGFAVDNAMVQEPVDGVAEYHGFDHLPSYEWDNEIYELWSQTGQTWQDSLEVLRSVRYLKPLPPISSLLNEARNPDVKVRKNKHGIYYAYLGRTRVGQAQLYDYESDGMAENERYIWKSAVHPNHTRKGVATELYNVIAADLESRGLKLVPSPDSQLSGDAYQFWKARDPESIKGHGTYKAEELQHLVGREIEVRGRPVVVTRVGWSKASDAPLIGVRFTDVPEGSVNSTGQVRMSDVQDQLTEDDGDTLKLPDIDVGDELMVGKFKNRKATVKGFTKDKHNQPIAKTDKGDQQIFKGRVKKLMDEARLIEAGEYSAYPGAEALIDELHYKTTPYHGSEYVRVVLNYNSEDYDQALIQVKPEGDSEVRLDKILSSEAGKGSGTIAMNLLVSLADKHGVPIVLSVEATEDMEGMQAMNDNQLAKWYERFGFVSDKRAGDHMFNLKRMRREPRGATNESQSLNKIRHTSEKTLMERFAQQDVDNVSWFWAHPSSGRIYHFEGSHTTAAVDPNGPIAIDINYIDGDRDLSVDDYRVFEAAFRQGWVRSMYIPDDGSPLGNQVGLHGPDEETVRLTLKMLLDKGLQVDRVGMQGHYDGFEYDEPFE